MANKWKLIETGDGNTYFIESVEKQGLRMGLKSMGDRCEMKMDCLDEDCMWTFVADGDGAYLVRNKSDNMRMLDTSSFVSAKTKNYCASFWELEEI